MNLLVILYWLFAALHLAGEIIGEPSLRIFTKPLLMPVLIAWYFMATRSNRTTVHWLMMIAFAFSCAGDIFLMYTTEAFFLLGLTSFLITHVLYIISFRSESKLAGGRTLISRKPYLIIPIALVAGVLIGLIFNRIEQAMKVPVIVYAAVITTMIIAALNRSGKVSEKSFQAVFIGALIFMFSDSLIALNKFYFNGGLWHASFFIMLLYVSGQFLIAKGTAKNN